MDKVKNKTNEGATSSQSKTEELIDSKELAKRLKVSVKTISNWRKQKTIPCYEIRGSIRFDWNKVLQTFNENNHQEAA